MQWSNCAHCSLNTRVTELLLFAVLSPFTKAKRQPVPELPDLDEGRQAPVIQDISPLLHPQGECSSENASSPPKHPMRSTTPRRWIISGTSRQIRHGS